jgi:hypothetical protein
MFLKRLTQSSIKHAGEMQQKQASQKTVFLGVLVGLSVCSIPFMFKSVRTKEQNVAKMRDQQDLDAAKTDDDDDLKKKRLAKDDARDSRLKR